MPHQTKDSEYGVRKSPVGTRERVISSSHSTQADSRLMGAVKDEE